MIPIFGVVGIVMATRARKMAKKYQLVVPVHATLGLVIGVFGIVASVFFYVLVIVQEIQRSDRIELLEQRVGAQASAQVLSPEVACDLAEIRALKDGIGGRSGTNIDDVECNGSLDLHGSKAVLHDFSLRVDKSGSRHYFKACLTRGVRWSVSGFRKSASCDEPDDTEGLFEKKSAERGAAQSVASPATASAPSGAGGTSGSAPSTGGISPAR